MFVTNWNSTTKIQKISEITNFFRHYFLSRTEVAFYPWQFRGGRNLPEATHRQHSLQYSEERTVCL